MGMLRHLLAEEGVESSNLFIRSRQSPEPSRFRGFVCFETRCRSHFGDQSLEDGFLTGGGFEKPEKMV